ncbi:hypothetical protein GCM10017673_20990 [Streptosporangium violaceochromogenes]|nr:hypothetical protein GCM10017673_20990 [Streptosporangium violaceochromogenes]
MSRGWNVVAGVAAAAAGTTALNIAAYLDMAVRARPASELPGEAADDLAGRAGVDLGSGEAGTNRREGLGALLGYATGLSVGALYGLLAGDRRPPPVAAALGLSAAAMIAGDTPLAALGLTDPGEWGVSSWAADAVPHLAYGLTTATVYHWLTRPPRRR